MATVRTPEEVAETLATEAPDEDWLRALVEGLDRRLAARPLERLIHLWGLSGAEVGRVFGVSRQAVSKWRDQGVPPGRADDLAALTAATDLLNRYVKRERIPAVVRRPAEDLGGRSLYEVASEGEFDRVREQVERMFDLARVQA
jgi:hypothetical protein